MDYATLPQYQVAPSDEMYAYEEKDDVTLEPSTDTVSAELEVPGFWTVAHRVRPSLPWPERVTGAE